MKQKEIQKVISRTQALNCLAEQMELDPLSAVALPAVIAVSAAKISMTEDALIRECRNNPDAREYLADVCRSIDVREVLL